MKRNRRSNRQQVVSNFFYNILYAVPKKKKLFAATETAVCVWHEKERQRWRRPMYRWAKLLLVENKNKIKNSISFTKSLIKLVSNLVWATNEKKKYRRTHSRANHNNDNGKNELSANDQEYFIEVSAQVWTWTPFGAVFAVAEQNKVYILFILSSEERRVIDRMCYSEPCMLPSCNKAYQHMRTKGPNIRPKRFAAPPMH